MKEALLAPVYLIGLLGLAYLPGRFLLKSLNTLTRLDRVVIAVALGLGIVGYIILGLGLIGFLSPVFFGVLLASGLVGLYFLAQDLRGSPTGNSSPADNSRRGPLPLVCGVVLALLGICTFVAALAPPAGLEWDSLSYHLAAPKIWLQTGRVIYLPWDHHSNFPFTLEMLYIPMLALGSMSAAKLCHWLCGALLVASIYHLPGESGKGKGGAGSGGHPRFHPHDSLGIHHRLH